jgi:hypothetical protein
MDVAAATKLFDALRPKTEGEPVNVHVVSLAKESAPDFEAMRKVIAGENDDGESKRPDTERAKREVPGNK